MNNDDIKKYIDLSKLYTEVDLEKNEKVDEGILDWLENWLDEKKAKQAVDEIPADVRKDLDKVVDDNKLADGNVKVTTQDQANSIFQNPDATDAERKAAQDFYNANKGTAGDNAAGNNFATDADGNIARKDDPIQPGGQDAGAPVGKSFTDIGQAMLGRDQVKVGDKVTINGQPATVDAGTDGKKFYIDANGKPITAAATAGNDGSVDAVGSEEDPTVTDQEGGVAQGMDQADAADAEPANTKDLMTRYNEGGKKAMPEIKKLQTELGRLGFDPNGIDGKYGNGTFKAVQQFQKANGLQVDGQAGTNTLAAIEKAIKGEASPGDGSDKSNKAKGQSAQASDDAAATAGAGKTADNDGSFDDPMTAANQQKDIDTAQPNADVDRYIELLNKLEGGQVNAGTPNATQGQVVASYDFRNLIALVESKLLNEQLTQAEMEELKALHNKVQGHVGIDAELDTKITTALNRYLKLVKEPGEQEPDAKLQKKRGFEPEKADDGTTPAEKPKVTLDSLSAQIKKGITMQQFEKIVKDAEALEPQDAAKDANILKKFGAAANKLFSTADYRSRYVIANGAKNLGLKGLYRPDGSSYIFIGSDGKPAGARGANLKAALAVAQAGLLPQSKVDSIGKIAAKGKPDFQAVIDAHNKATGATPQVKKQVSPSTGRPDDAGATQQTASKDNNMKKAIKEASMNISINGDSAAEVAELAGILKNAGMPNAAPVSDIMAPPVDHGHMDGHDDMVSKMRMMDEPAPDDSPCGMGEEGVEEDSWDNSPDEAYADTQTMTKDLSGGLNREKKAYAAAQDGDNAMAVETSIKEQLWAALNEKMTAEGGKKRGMKMKTLKASRGNEDIQTTEGSKGKKSRGEKKKSSRG